MRPIVLLLHTEHQREVFLQAERKRRVSLHAKRASLRTQCALLFCSIDSLRLPENKVSQTSMHQLPDERPGRPLLPYSE